MRPCSSLLTIIPAVLFAISAGAAEPATTAAPSAFTFIDHIGDDCDNLFVVGDVLPPLQRVLNSEPFRRVVLEGRLAQSMASSGADPADSILQLEANSHFIPSEIAVGFPSSAYADFVNVARFALALGLCSGATTAGEEAIQTELPSLQAILLDSTKALKVPRVTVWVRFRDPQMAAMLFNTAAAAAPQLTAQADVDVEVDQASLHLKARLGSLIPSQMIAAGLLELGAADLPDDPQLSAIANELAKLEAELWLEQFDSGLRLTLGPRPANQSPVKLSALGPLWQPQAAPLAYGKWRLGPLKASLDELDNTWQQWRETQSGQAMKSRDDEDLLGNMILFVNQVRRASNSATFRVTADDKLDAILYEQGFQPAVPLATSPAVQLLPREAEYLRIDARKSVGDHLIEMLAKVEDRLARQQLRADLRGQEEKAQAAQKMIDQYYQHFAEFRRLIFEESAQVFEQPFAVVATARGRIEQFELTFDEPPGEQNRLTIRNAPWFEYALVGRLKNPSQPFTLADKLLRAFLRGMLEDVPDEVTVARDLGLGVPTVGFNQEILSGLPANVSITISRDVQPHYFVLDGWVVFSSSTRLSKSMLDAWRGPGQRYTLPKPRTGELVAFGRIPAATIAEASEHALRLMNDVFSGEGMVEKRGPLMDEFTLPAMISEDVIVGLSDIIRLGELVQWATVDRGTIRETRFRTTFAANTPDP